MHLNLTRDGDVEKITTALDYLAASLAPDADLLRSLGYPVGAADVDDYVVALRELVSRINEQGAGGPGDFVCAECGTRDATTYVVTGRVDDREGRTEVCQPCAAALDA